MKRTIFFRIFAGFFLLTVVISSLILAVTFKTVRTYYIGSLTSDLKDLCVSLGPQTSNFVLNSDIKGLGKFVKDIDAGTRKRITVIDTDGVVLADSENDPAQMENHRARPEVSQALNGSTGISIRHSATVQQDMLYVAVPLRDRGGIFAVLRVSLFLKDVDLLLGELKKHIRNITLVILLTALAGALLFSRSLAAPLLRLSDASKKVAGGDFSIKVKTEGTAEIKELSESFNYMTGKVNGLFEELSGRREELDAIINSMRESIILVSEDDRIKLSNKSFERIAGMGVVAGKYYWEAFRASGFKELMEGFNPQEGPRSAEVEFTGRVYQCGVTRLQSGNEKVVVLHDITEAKDLEKKKKDFVANVSHELRTPLSAIKGFAETLDGCVKGENGNYLTIIQRNTDRLINIVEDLLQLSQLEEKGFGLVLGKTDLKTTAENVLKLFDARLKEKGLSVKLVTSGVLKPVTADAYRIEQMLINLIDNALKYTDKGSIEVSIAQDESKAKLTVSDTGIGIPQDSVPHIFERFYVVDKSRSKKTGGTGLGLSIVKHIVLMHSGSINVESEEGRGTKFTVTLPVA